MPGGVFIGGLFAIAQIVGGVAVALPRTMRPGAVILAITYLLFGLMAIPGMLAAPLSWGSYGPFFEEFAMVCGCAALLGFSNDAVRIGFGLCVVSFTLLQAFYLQATASFVPAWMPPSQMFWTVLTTIAFGLGAVAILTNLQARLAGRLIVLMLALFGLMVWLPAILAHPASHLAWGGLFQNFLIDGSAWIVVEVAIDK